MYQIRICSEQKAQETAATLDHAMLRAAARSKSEGGRWVVERVESYEKTIRAIGVYGKAHFTRVCPACRGAGNVTTKSGSWGIAMASHCLDCFGIGHVPEDS